MYILISFLPVILFLLYLIYMDSFKIIKLNLVLINIFWGLSAAALSYFISYIFAELLKVNSNHYVNFYAPLIEETIKASYIIFLFRFNKIGFLIDAAIIGFAVGSGFALLENLFYMAKFNDPSFLVIVLRGFGTAIMHGGSSSLFAILTASLLNREFELKAALLPGIIIAVLIHLFYNSLVLPPILNVLLIMIAFPVFFLFIFRKNEDAIVLWLETGFDTEADLLSAINLGELKKTNSGKYLNRIKDLFDPLIVFDMLNFVKIYLELSMRAKGILMMQENDLDYEITSEDKYKLRELLILESNIGKAGISALKPILGLNKRDLWTLNRIFSE